MAIAPAGRGFEVLGVYGLFLALTTLTVGLRAYCRLRIQKAFGWDDWFATLSWVFFVLHASFAITGVHHGTGQHAWNIQPPSVLPVGLKFWWLCEPVYVLSNMAIKASIAIMLMRLSVRRSHKIILYVTIIITEIYSAFFFFLFIFQCIPSKYFWTRYTGGSGSCLDTSIVVAATYGYSAITCAGDIIFSILPVLLVWSLQMGRKEKVAVILILAMGAIASVATIIRIPYVHTLADKDDFLYATTDIAIWSCSETGLGITAACCAVLRPLFRKTLVATGFLSSGPMSRMDTPTFASQGNTKNTRRGYKRSSSSEWPEEEVTLQSLKAHGQKPGKDGKGFGTTASVWHPDDEEAERDAQAGTSPLGAEIMVTRTRDVTRI
ncbi:hypothetical protein WHR41_00400 [Cladosporium halotolerans]|uniref:Rhodopsin domain-containing protein n=1 Tax=Cladosporium halotolerans TaxID=1052096 RepID=A0AB34L303_9PEZI